MALTNDMMSGPFALRKQTAWRIASVCDRVFLHPRTLRATKVSPSQELTLAPPPSPSDAPLTMFRLAAILGLVAAVPGFALAAVSVADALAHSSQRLTLTDVLFWLAIGATGPLSVVLSVIRMMRRPDRPIAVSILSLFVTAAPTTLLLAMATFAPSSSSGILCLSLLGLLSGFVAGVLAIVATVRRRRAA